MNHWVTSESVVWTGGLGDLITLESYMTPEERDKIRCMYLATPAARSIMRLLADAPRWFPSLGPDGLHVVWDDWEIVRALHLREELLRICPSPPDGYREAQDLSIRVVFRQLMTEHRPHRGSALLGGSPLAGLPHGLPDKYICVHPGTDSPDYGAGRNMDTLEWVHLARWMSHTGQYAVIVGTDKQRRIDCDRIVDLQGLTTLAQSVEILRRATGYIGIDSWLSVLAAQLFGPLDLQIKSVNQHLYIYKRLYYAPHVRYPFLRTNLQISGPDEYVVGKPTQAENSYLHCCYRDDVWYHPQTLDTVQYDDSYWHKYQRYEESDLGRKLTAFRGGLVAQYVGGDAVLDFGIGSGQFIRGMHANSYSCFGFDVCPQAVKHLHYLKSYCNPWIDIPGDIEAVTMWDTLEHLIAPSKLLARLRPGTWLFVSIPIYPHNPLANGQAPSITQWKHYRPGEHYYYWTDQSFRAYLDAQGCQLVAVHDDETRLGRQDILTYVARKRDHGSPRPILDAVATNRSADG